MTKSVKHYKDIRLNPLPEREMEILGSITAERMSDLREKAIKKFKDSVELPGFRKGNAPESLVAQKVGEMKLLEEAAEIAIGEEYPNILEEHKVDAIGRPEILITKLAPGNQMEFKVKTSLMPDVKLADYKKTAKNKAKESEGKKVEVTEKEIEEVIKTIRQNVAHQKMHEDIGLDEHKHDHAEIKDEDLPEVNDEFVKKLGDFKDVADFKAKVEVNIKSEKEFKEKDRRRTEILNKIIEDSTITLPKIIVDGELEKMIAEFKEDLAKSGIPFEDYLKHIKKSEEDIKKDWRETAVKRAKSQVILNNIAKEESIAPKEEEVKKEMEHILSHYKDADRFRVRMYVETFLTNELVFQFLESQK